MNLIYNSEQYSVTEFGADTQRETLRFGGYEIIDKCLEREIFIVGSPAKTFREGVKALIASEPTVEDVDNFLSYYGVFMHQPIVLH